MLDLFTCYLFFRKLNNIPAYGQDHLKFGRFCVNRSSEFYLLEDGLGNYINPIKILKLKNNHRLIFFVKLFIIFLGVQWTILLACQEV